MAHNHRQPTKYASSANQIRAVGARQSGKTVAETNGRAPDCLARRWPTKYAPSVNQIRVVGARQSGKTLGKTIGLVPDCLARFSG
jgi:hypothetical protein